MLNTTHVERATKPAQLEQADMQWTIEENDILLDAIERGCSPDHIAETVSRKTGRSPESIIRRLGKIGYLRRCGRSFAQKQGFVR